MPMRRMSSSVEVQRVLILMLTIWLLAGAYLRDPFWLVVARAFAATFWTLLLGWSFLFDSPVARTARVTIGTGLATGCAASFGASLPALLAVALGAGALLAGAEHLVHRRVTA
jgi:hypothetical protein